MKFWKVLGSVLDWLGKNLSRVKTIGIIVLVVFFFLSLGKNGCQHREAEELIERITGLNVRNDILQRDVQERDSLIIAKEARIEQARDSLRASQANSARLRTLYTQLQTKYDNLAESLIQIPADSSYDFLIHEAYPYTGQMKYPFNEPQVKGIHLTYMQKIQLEGLNTNLAGQLREYENQLSLKDTVYAETSKVLAMERASKEDLKAVVSNQDQIVTEQEKQIDKERKRKTFWKITSGILVALAAGLAL